MKIGQNWTSSEESTELINILQYLLLLLLQIRLPKSFDYAKLEFPRNGDEYEHVM